MSATPTTHTKGCWLVENNLNPTFSYNGKAGSVGNRFPGELDMQLEDTAWIQKERFGADLSGKKSLARPWHTAAGSSSLTQPTARNIVWQHPNDTGKHVAPSSCPGFFVASHHSRWKVAVIRHQWMSNTLQRHANLPMYQMLHRSYAM